MARKISKEELLSFIMEEVEKVEKELSDEANKTKEVQADEYADTLAHKVDYEKAAKIKPTVESLLAKENKAIRMAKILRKQRLALQEQVEKENLKKENLRLKKAVNRLKSQG